jgi:hypothetical protein
MLVFPMLSKSFPNRSNYQVIVNAVVLSWVTNTMSDHVHSSGPSIHAPQHIERNVGKDDVSRPVPPVISTTLRHDDLEHGPRSPTLRAIMTFFTRTSSDSEDDHGVTSLEESLLPLNLKLT